VVGALGTLCAISNQDVDLPADELTGLRSRTGFRLVCEHLLALCRRNRMPALVIYLEVLPPAGGPPEDQLDRDAADVLSSSFRRADVVARLGASQFAALLVEYTEQPEIALGHLAEALELRNMRFSNQPPLELAIGTAHFDPSWPAETDDLLEQARASLLPLEAAEDSGGG
jgi:GGDEF domain-containing protein